MTGGSVAHRRKTEKVEEKKEEDDTKGKDSNEITFFFDPGHYTVMENVGKFTVTVTREGDLSQPVELDFQTEDGTANEGSDYEGFNGTIIFHAGEAHKAVFLSVIDDDVFEEDEHFYCRISNPRYVHPEVNGGRGGETKKRPELKLGVPSVATVMILDDDHGGIFSFPEESIEVSESEGLYLLKVNRFSGARGKVFLPYRVVEGTAKEETDFVLKDGQIVFENNESTSEIPVQIIDNESYEKDCVFYIELDEPIREEDMVGYDKHSLSSEDEKIALLGKPRLGDTIKCTIRIKESKEFKVSLFLLLGLLDRFDPISCPSMFYVSMFYVRALSKG